MFMKASSIIKGRRSAPKGQASLILRSIVAAKVHEKCTWDLYPVHTYFYESFKIRRKLLYYIFIKRNTLTLDKMTINFYPLCEIYF